MKSFSLRLNILGLMGSIGLLSSNVALAQVPKTTVVEHFTNTSCSVCANNNAAIHAAINAKPNAIHISFHPSSPYTTDIFNPSNKLENDNRTKYYNLFGSTPKMAVNGSNSNITTFNTVLNAAVNEMTNFRVKAVQTQLDSLNFKLEVTVIKVAADTLPFAYLFAGVMEDTIQQTTRNGEPTHFHVFRKALSNIVGDSIVLPMNVDDSTTISYMYQAQSAWDKKRLNSIVILNQANKKVVNSALAQKMIAQTTGLTDPTISYEENDILYPNPIQTSQVFSKIDADIIRVFNTQGVQVQMWKNVYVNQQLEFHTLESGVYFIQALRGRNSIMQKVIR